MQSGIRIREAAEPTNTISIGDAAKKYGKYGVDKSTISRWVTKGEVTVVKVAAFPGDTVLLEDISLRRRLSTYTPHRDNAGKRTRRRTVPEMMSVATPSATATAPVRTVAAARAPKAASPQGLNTQEWVNKYYEYQDTVARISPKTRAAYDLTFGRFCRAFPVLPMGLAARRPVLDYIYRLKSLSTGEAMHDGTKKSHLKRITAFYHWLSREQAELLDSLQVQIPDLTASQIADPRTYAVPIYEEDIKLVLDSVRNHTEYTLVLLLAQTGMRQGELCTLRPETTYDHWAYVWGKPTKNNPTGQRPVPIPEPAFTELMLEFETYGELVTISQTTGAKPVAQAPVAVNPRQGMDLKDPKSFRVNPHPTGEDQVKYHIHALLDRAGVYRLGMAAHSFRRAYEQPFLANGGDALMCNLIMGHVNKSDMASLYFHSTIETMVEQAKKYAPRGFLPEGGSK